MGTYRQPGLNTNVKFATINQTVAEGQKAFQVNFEHMQREYADNAARNQKAKDKQDLAKANGMARWNKALKDATPKGGFAQTQDAFLKEKQAEYYSLLGKTDEYSLSRIGQLLAMPTGMSEGQGAFSEIGKSWEIATNLGEGEGGVDWYNSSAMNVDFLQDNQLNGAANITPREIDGNVYWVLTDPKTGEEQILNNQELVKGSLEGNSFFNTTGGIATTMDPFMAEQIKGLPGDYKGKIVTDRTTSTHTTYKDYTEDNAALAANLEKADFSATMSNQKYMTSVFPQLIDRVQKAYERDVAEGNEATSEAGLLLYGEDRKPGGTGVDADYDLLTNKKAHAIDANLSVGSWVGSEPGFGDIAEQQKAIAKFGLIDYAMDSENGLVKPDRVQTGVTYTKGQGGGTGATLTSTQKNFRAKVTKPENIKRYGDYQGVASQIVNRFEWKDDGIDNDMDVLGGRSDVGKKLLVAQLNKAAKEAALSNPNNPSLTGGYTLTDKGEIIFEYYPNANGTQKPAIAVDIKWDQDRDKLESDIRKLLAVTTGGIKEDEYDYYERNYGNDKWVFKRGDKGGFGKGSGRTRMKGGTAHQPKNDAEFKAIQKSAKKGDRIYYKGKLYQKTK